ncbi:MAG: glycosyltransferase family 4 protein [Nocardioides sp.]|uniref:glycosyltransferase family 4 protein n=1 Tax=Nocardioides sp. TaxID=35761 RepID=UPI003F07BA02
MSPHHEHPLSGREVVFLSWRDTENPEAGGAERYLQKMAEGLRDRGARVTVFSASSGAPREETKDGIRYRRGGGKLGVYPRGMAELLSGRLGRPDVVVDVQNGLPFFSRVVTRRPVVVLVHHVHREQWPVVYPGVTGRIGWWVEHRLAPRLYRRDQYVAVSRATRTELAGLGVSPDRVAVVHNGTDPAPPSGVQKTAHPSVCVVGRLVPHKQVEHAIDAVVELRREFPTLTLDVVGGGWWSEHLAEHVAQRGAGDFVRLLGHVSEEDKQAAYARSWLMLLPSLKEGWGLVVGEAAMHSTPTIAYRSAGGTTESIKDGRSGLLVDTYEEFRDTTAALLRDDVRRKELGAGALEVSHEYTWQHGQESFAAVIESALEGRTVSAEDPDEPHQD